MPRPTAPLATPQWKSALPMLLSMALIIGFLYWARPVLIPVALAILITFLLAPVVTWLTRRRFGRVPSATLVTLAALSITVLVGWAIARQVGSLLESYPQYERNINAKIASLRWVGREGTLERARNVARRMQRQLERADVEDTPEEAEVRKAQPVRMVVDPGPFRIAEFWSFAAPILSPLAAAALVIVLVFFMLLGREDLRDRFIALIGERQLAQTTNALDDAGSRISRFLMTQLAINAGFGVVVGIGLFLIGIPFAPLWGAIAFVLRYIPYLGPWLALLLPFAMALLVSRDWSAAFSVVGLFAVVEGVTNLLIEPTLYGRGIGVSQTSLLVAVAFWTWLWGPVGLVLASPLTVCLVVLGRHAPNLKFLDTLLGDRPALEPPQRFYQRLLARDHDEATEIADAELERRPLFEVYEHLLLPALNAVRQDARFDRIEDSGMQQLSE
ncbi:MAG: AI-2E family transporter, partial [Lysobacterales bacterium]